MKGIQLSPEQAAADGIVHFLVEPEELEPKARDYAVRLARQAPIALRGIKRAIRAAQSPDGLAVEGEAFREVLVSQSTRRRASARSWRASGPPFRASKTASLVGTLCALRLEAGVTHSPYYVRRRRQARVRRIKRLSLAAVVALVVAVVVVAVVYAGSSSTLAHGVRIDGVDVGGMSSAQATKTLQQRARVSAREAGGVRCRRSHLLDLGLEPRSEPRLGRRGRRRAPERRRLRPAARLQADEAPPLRQRRRGDRVVPAGRAECSNSPGSRRPSTGHTAKPRSRGTG